MNKKVVNSATLTCPNCTNQLEVAMPVNACVIFWICPQCAIELKPKMGDCCVFCSYSDSPCPPIQEIRETDKKCGSFESID